MLVTNNTLLNILLPNDNKVLKDVLKEADSKTLEQLVKNNSASINDVLKDLFDGLKNGTKSNTTIENILKNSTVFKDLGAVANNLTSLLENISQDENLQKFKPLIENFLKNIKDMDANTLKEQLKNSGVFLESKIAQSSTPNSKIETILNQIQNLIKDLNTPQAKQVNELISKLLQSPMPANTNNDLAGLKTLTTALQNLNNSLSTPQTQNLSTLINQLQNVVNEGSLVESKVENSVNNQNLQTKDSINLQTKELLTQLKNEVIQNPTLQNKNILPLLENLLKMDNLFAKNENLSSLLTQNNLSTFTSNFASNLNPLLSNLKESLENLNPNDHNLQNQVMKFVEKIESIIKDLANPSLQKNDQTNLTEDVKSVLLKMQDELASKTDPKSQELAKQVDKLLTQIDYQQLLSLSSNSNNVYLPFFWEMLEEGNISMKKTDEEKFYCQINLTLKDFGKVDLMLALYDKNKLDLTVYAQREHFKTALRDNMQALKIALNSVELIPVNIKLLDLKDENESKDEPTKAYINNSYNQNSNLSSGIDIRV
ncbi:flagellar hook-length control protein FliK [Arcobacter suis]|uniref:Flagellar hook-length control protein FliK n=2 Tax=Arcobacter suis TaxID=1278212 RepID=A0AAD0SSB4_9BACT|nr:flagellar hook-length control protein FliK [Arcobacter suis]AXX90033.1 flagellar hook-length control protein FliK [Arcobacter suis CECT 7833]RWS47166.1 flagellar hook-length control protein FliK [Arcobacter suis]